MLRTGKENERASTAVRSSYVAQLEKRQAIERVRQSVAARSVSERLMRKSLSLRPVTAKSKPPSIPATAVQSPLSSLAAGEALLDDAAAKLEHELQSYDQKLQLIKSHVPNRDAARSSVPHCAVAQRTADATAEPSLVRAIITATGQGCRDIVAIGGVYEKRGNVVWKTRPHKAVRTESSCTLQLAGRRHRDVAIRITFAEALTVPAILCFEHASTPTAPFVPLGQVPLQAKSMKQLKHVFRLGKDVFVDRCLRITALGHIGQPHAGLHAVSHLEITGMIAPTDTETMDAQSPPSAASCAGSSTGTVQPESSTPTSATQQTQVDEQLEVEVVATGEDSLSQGVPSPRQNLEGAANSGVDRKSTQQNKRAPPPPPPLPPSTIKRAPPPPPPPLPSGAPRGGAQCPSNKAQISEPAATVPSRPTVKLFWEKVQPRDSVMPRTVWGQLPGGDPQVDFAKLEEEFAAKAPGIALKPGRDAGDAGRKRALTGPRVLTVHRATNVGAMLARLKLSPKDAKSALLRFLGDEDGETSLTDEDVESLLHCLPTDDERDRFASLRCNDHAALVPAEQFMISLSGVPALKERLQAFVFLRSFDGRTREVHASAQRVTAACMEVRDSSLLRSILKTALAIGNFLNAGNCNGSAAGFQVDALLKLKDVKSTRTRSRTLLHFLAREVSRLHPGNASLTTDLPSARAASRICLNDLRAELDALAEGIESAHRAGRNSGADVAHMEELLSSATDLLAEANARVVEADASFLELRTFLNGRQATMDDSAAFFGLMSTFCQQLDAAHADNAAADVAAKKASEKTARNSQRAGNTSGLASATSGGPCRKNPTQRAERGDSNAAEDNATPPLQRRDKLLATIRAYSKLSANERRSLLTDTGAAERLQALGITHRHSVTVPSAAVFDEAGTTRENVGQKGAANGDSNRDANAALRASAPSSISLSKLMAANQEKGPVDHNEGPSSSSSALQQRSPRSPQNAMSTVEEESQILPSPSAAAPKEDTHGVEDTASTSEAMTSPVTSVSLSGSPQSATREAAGPVLSTPVARMLATSRALVKSVELRGHDAALLLHAVPSKSAMDRAQNDDDGSSSEVSLGGAAGQCTLPPSQTGTPQMWRQQSQSGRRGDVAVEESAETSVPQHRIRSDEERPPSRRLFETNASLAQAPSHARVWQSSAVGLSAADSDGEQEGSDDLREQAVHRQHREVCDFQRAEESTRHRVGDMDVGAGHGADDGVGVLRAAASALWHDQHQRHNEEAPEQSNGLPQLDASHDALHHAAPTSSYVHHRNPVGILRSSADWPLTSRRCLHSSGGHSLRGSIKRVSFSLPNSPRQTRTSLDNDNDARYVTTRRETTAVRRDTQESYGNAGEAFDASAAAAHADVGDDDQPRRSSMQRDESFAEEVSGYDEWADGGQVYNHEEGVGLDLNLAAQLMANAERLRKSGQSSAAALEDHEAMDDDRVIDQYLDSGLPEDFENINRNESMHTRHQHQEEEYHSVAGLRAEEESMRPATSKASAPVATATDARAGQYESGHDIVHSSNNLSETQAQAARVLSKVIAESLRRSLPALQDGSSPALPGLPQGASPLNLDLFMAAVIANAGNTPTGPLARGVRSGDKQLFDDVAAETLRRQGEQREAAARRQHRQRKALLEPIIPAPLGMGVRASDTVAHGVSPTTLRENLKAHLRADTTVLSLPTTQRLDGDDGGEATVAGAPHISQTQVAGGLSEMTGAGNQQRDDKGRSRASSVRELQASLAKERLAYWEDRQNRHRGIERERSSFDGSGVY